MSAFVDEATDGGSATRPWWCDTSSSSRVVVSAAAWVLRRTLGTVLRDEYGPSFSHRRDVDHVSARGGEMPSSGRHEEMDLCTDKVLSKGRILQELTKAVKLVSDYVTAARNTARSVPRPPSRTTPVATVACLMHARATRIVQRSSFPFSRKHGYPLRT
jgi:hypothetical protein